MTKKKKSSKAALIGTSIAALAGAAAYISYSQGSWPFKGRSTGSGSTPGAALGNSGEGQAKVDVALTNEVASYTEHNPNNAGDFTDDGATGNAD